MFQWIKSKKVRDSSSSQAQKKTRAFFLVGARLCAYPGAYSGSITLYPKALKVKPTGDAAITEEDEPSARNWIPSDDPRTGCLRPMDITVAITAMPSTIVILARNELPEPVCPLFPFPSTTLVKLSSSKTSSDLASS